MESTSATTSYHRVTVDGVGIFYREAGPKNAPTIVLLHGLPSSSREFDTLIPLLATRYRRMIGSLRERGLLPIEPIEDDAVTLGIAKRFLPSASDLTTSGAYAMKLASLAGTEHGGTQLGHWVRRF